MIIVHPSPVSGVINAPASKSMAQRAIAAATLCNEPCTILMGNPCDDTRAALGAAVALGADVASFNDGVRITGRVFAPRDTVDCGEAGLCLRMFSAVAATFPGRRTLLAQGPLKTRPANMVEAPLLALGAGCTTSDGFPPVVVEGPLRGGAITIDATTSSQFLTGLLIALPTCNGKSRIAAPGLKSKPYVRMTIELLARLGVTIETTDNLEQFTIKGDTKLSGFELRVEGDWSGASFPLVAGAIAGQVTVTGLDAHSAQADRRILEALEWAGATVKIDGDSITAARAPLGGFEFDATHCPDLFPPLCALAINAKGESRIHGVHRLATKESNRKLALISEFGVLGGRISVTNDTMIITGGPLCGGQVEAHHDHRIAMAMGLAALNATGPVIINGADSITKSYPDFFKDMKQLGVTIS